MNTAPINIAPTNTAPANTRPNYYCLLIAASTLFMLACSPAPQNQEPSLDTTSEQSQQQSEDARLVTFLDSLFDRDLLENPNAQSSLGVDLGGLDKWTDSSDAALQKTIAKTKADIESLQAQFSRDALSVEGKLNYDIALAKWQTELEEMAFNRHVYVADQFYGQYMGPMTLLQNNHKIQSVKDAENYIARLIGIKALMQDMVARMQDRAEIGVIPPAFSFPDMLKDLNSVLSGAPLDDSEAEHPLYQDFKSKVDALVISTEKKSTLIGRAIEALRGPFSEGYTAVLDETKRLQRMQTANDGVWALPDGQAFYEMRVKRFTTLDLSAEEVHNIGLTDVASIHEQLKEIMRTLDFEGSLQDFFAFIRNDPNNYYPNNDQGRAAFLEQAREDTARIFAIADEYFHTLPKAGLEIKRVEPWRENSTSIAFYNRPSQDASRPGVYYANLADMSGVQKYVFRSITFHEGVPGHHFQIARMQEFTDVPTFRKYHGMSVYTEGWALYSERLASEMGMTPEPLYDAGRLQSELWRAVRLVVDTGIHAKRWTRQQAIDYFLENTPISEQDIVTEVERYFVLPGQALSYKIGMNKMLELRADAEQALGDKFDIRDFHEALIGAGAMPMPILINRVNEYIDNVKKS